jgi:hypothetical protein
MVEQQLGRNTGLTVNYNGNHVIRLPFSSQFPNAWDAGGIFPGVTSIPSSPVVPNYGQVQNTQSGAISNYNGLTVSVREQSGSWFLGHFNYTFSHSFDEISNGGLFQYQIGYFQTSILNQLNPTSLRAGNYGNSEYDIRHLFSADYIISPQVRFENKFAKAALGGWQWSGKIFLRTGYPFTVLDGNVGLGNYTGAIPANQLSANGQIGSCGRPAANAYNAGSTSGCLNPAAFTDTASATFAGYSVFPQQGRNQFRGPGYFDMDMALYKTFSIKERATLGIGITAFNVFNHPNFAMPDNLLGDPTFGQQASMEGVPASPYGNFLGFDSSPRVVQLTAKFNF